MKITILFIISLLSLVVSAAPKKKNKVDIDALYTRIENALENYDIEAADEAFDELSEALKKAKRANEPRFEKLAANKQLIENMLTRVEDIRIIVARNISTNRLFVSSDIKLPMSAEAGSWHGSAWFNNHNELPHDSLSVVFIPTSGREIFWSAPSGKSRTIWQAGMLLDGTLDNPHEIFEPKDFDGIIDLNTPFLASDGLTLYFSGNIPGNTIGGHDIFRASRHGVGEKFSMPTNMGMPYSSVHFDGFFAIDPETELAFFVTDRTKPGSKEMKLFAFLPNEVRTNRPDDFEDPTNNLSVADSIATFIPTTWPKGFKAQAYIARLEKFNTNIVDESADGGDFNDDLSTNSTFSLYVPSARRVYTKLSDFHNDAARQAMAASLETAEALDSLIGQVEAMRHAYAKGEHSLAPQILQAETTLSSLKSRLRSQRNTAIRLEAQSH